MYIYINITGYSGRSENELFELTRANVRGAMHVRRVCPGNRYFFQLNTGTIRIS